MGINYITRVKTPDELKSEYSLREDLTALKAKRDAEIADVITGKSDKFLVIIGPCSADNEDAVCDYTSRLASFWCGFFYFPPQLFPPHKQYSYKNIFSSILYARQVRPLYRAPCIKLIYHLPFQ